MQSFVALPAAGAVVLAVGLGGDGEFARRACFERHSNEAEWLWYTSVAPISWVTQRYVDERRAALN